MAYNNNFFNFNEDPYYTPTSFSDITNPAYHNFDQPSVPEWSYPNEYNVGPKGYTLQLFCVLMMTNQIRAIW